MNISAISSLQSAYTLPQERVASKTLAQNIVQHVAPAGGDSDGDNDGSGSVNIKA